MVVPQARSAITARGGRVRLGEAFEYSRLSLLRNSYSGIDHFKPYADTGGFFP